MNAESHSPAREQRERTRARDDDPDVGFDPFGRDPDLIQRLRPMLDALLDKYFRVEVTGAEHIPPDGRRCSSPITAVRCRGTRSCSSLRCRAPRVVARCARSSKIR